MVKIVSLAAAVHNWYLVHMGGYHMSNGYLPKVEVVDTHQNEIVIHSGLPMNSAEVLEPYCHVVSHLPNVTLT